MNLPKNNIEFELTLTKNDPVQFTKDCRYPELKYTGPGVKKATKKFKIVQVSYCKNLEEVREKLKAHGTVPSGLWLQALKDTYKIDELIGIADPSWVDPDGRQDFPYVDDGGESDFDWAGLDYDEYWRWLVEVGQVTGYLETGDLKLFESLNALVCPNYCENCGVKHIK